MENLRTWLNGCRDYTSGVVLYNEYGTDPALKRMFAEAETTFKHQRLVKVLEAIWDGRPKLSSPAPVVPIPKQQDPVKQLQERLEESESLIDELTEEKEDLEVDNEFLQAENEDLTGELHRLKKSPGKSGWPLVMDETLTALHAQWKKTFLEQKDLQSRLYEVARAGIKNKGKEKEAGTMALRILDLKDEIAAFYAKRDHYLEHGQLPDSPAPVEECLDPVLFKKRYDNAIRYTRTYKAELEALTPEDPRYPDKQKLLQKWEGETALYRKKLKMD